MPETRMEWESLGPLSCDLYQCVQTVRDSSGSWRAVMTYAMALREWLLLATFVQALAHECLMIGKVYEETYARHRKNIFGILRVPLLLLLANTKSPNISHYHMYNFTNVAGKSYERSFCAVQTVSTCRSRIRQSDCMTAGTSKHGQIALGSARRRTIATSLLSRSTPSHLLSVGS